MRQRLNNRVVMVTGAGGDIGCVTAARFAAEGARVAAVDCDVDALIETGGIYTVAGAVTA